MKKQLQASIAGSEWINIREEDREYLIETHDCRVKFRTVPKDTPLLNVLRDDINDIKP